jgi:hypothetical protein
MSPQKREDLKESEEWEKEKKARRRGKQWKIRRRAKCGTKTKITVTIDDRSVLPSAEVPKAGCSGYRLAFICRGWPVARPRPQWARRSLPIAVRRLAALCLLLVVPVRRVAACG